MSTAMVFPAFRSGTISSDIILWVLFLLSTALLSAVVVHETDGTFFFRIEVILVKVLQGNGTNR